jgi:hypothetical protein
MRYDLAIGQWLKTNHGGAFADFTLATTTQITKSRTSPDAEFEDKEETVYIYDDYTAIIWNDKIITKPTDAELQTAWAELQADEADEAINELRRNTYPSVGDQLDALWHAMDDGRMSKIEPMYSDCKTVKDTYPKQEIS